VPLGKNGSEQGFVPLPKRLAAELLAWRELTASPADQDFIFPNSLGGFMDYENFEARVLDPIRIQLGLGKLTFRSCAERSRRWHMVSGKVRSRMFKPYCGTATAHNAAELCKRDP
jgi:hypothetical protein